MSSVHLNVCVCMCVRACEPSFKRMRAVIPLCLTGLFVFFVSVLVWWKCSICLFLYQHLCHKQQSCKVLSPDRTDVAFTHMQTHSFSHIYTNTHTHTRTHTHTHTQTYFRADLGTNPCSFVLAYTQNLSMHTLLDDWKTCSGHKRLYKGHNYPVGYVE